MSIAKLSIDIEARLSNLQAGLDKAGLLAERQGERMQRAFNGANKALAAAGGAIAAAFSVSVITQWVNATVNGLDALNDLSDATGASVENLSALEDIAARTGTSMESAGDAVVKLNKALADAKPDNDIGAAFKALNLDVAELKRLDPVEAFRQVAVALSGFADDANKARLVQEFFGKSLKEVAPLLKDVAEAGTLQAKVTSQQAAEAEKFNKQIFEMQKNLLDLSRTVAGPFIKSMNALFEVWRSSRESGKGLLDTAFQMGKIDRIVAASAGTYSNEGRNYPKPTLPAGIAADKTSRTPKTSTGKIDQPFVGPELPDALAAALKRLEQADEAKLARLRQELGQLLTIAQSGGAVPASAFAQIAEDIARLDPAGRAADEALKKLAEDQARLNDILGATPTGKMEALLKQIEFINAQFAAGNIANVEQWAEAIRGATNTMDNDVKEAADKGIDAAKELGLSFSSAFEDAIVAGEDLRSVLAGLEKDILRIVTRKLVTEPLADGMTGLLGGLTSAGGSSGVGGVLGGLSSLFGGFFADGGFLPPGKWGMAGERGPEPIFGGRTGLSVQPAGGVTVNNTFVLPAGGYSRDTQQQIAASTARAVERASARNN